MTRRTTEKNFGVYRVTTPTVRAFQPKEAALAMWVMRNQLAGYRQTALEKVEKPGGTIWRATYTKGPLTKLVLFSDSTLNDTMPENTNKTTLAASDLIPAGKAVVGGVDAYNNQAAVTGPTIEVGTRPVFVTLSSSPVSITSVANGLHVTAWQDREGTPLEANAPHVANWEKFAVIDTGNGNVALRSIGNGKYVSAVQSLPEVPLRANASAVLEWETFRWVDNADGTFSLLSTVDKDATGTPKRPAYVSAWQTAPSSPLRAVAAQVDTWEKFTWAPQ